MTKIDVRERLPWRSVAASVTTVGTPVGIGVLNPALGEIVAIIEFLAALTIMATALFGSADLSNRAFRLLRWIGNRPEPPAPEPSGAGEGGPITRPARDRDCSRSDGQFGYRRGSPTACCSSSRPDATSSFRSATHHRRARCSAKVRHSMVAGPVVLPRRPVDTTTIPNQRGLMIQPSTLRSRPWGPRRRASRVDLAPRPSPRPGDAAPSRPGGRMRS